MKFVQEFKEFALKGHVIVVAVIIGGAFGKIVSAMVDDILMPVIAILIGKGQFTDLFYVINPQPGEVYNTLENAKKASVNVFAYGHFIQTIVDFFIIALLIFITIKIMARFKRKEIEKSESAPTFTPTEQLLMEIRDELRKNKTTA